MIYRCNGCGRVIANIRKLNLMELNGKSIVLDGNSLLIKCKCGKINKISLEKYKKEVSK